MRRNGLGETRAHGVELHAPPCEREREQGKRETAGYEPLKRERPAVFKSTLQHSIRIVAYLALVRVVFRVLCFVFYFLGFGFWVLGFGF